jgi:hypothetical protein
VPVHIVAAVAQVPTAPGASLVVDQSTIEGALIDAGQDPLPVNQAWLVTAGGRVPAGLPPGLSVVSRARLRSALLTSPLSAAPLLEGLAIAAAAAILAGLGFSAGVAASVRARREQSALLAALGYARLARAGGLCLEMLMLTLPAALAGLIVGAGLAQLIVPAVTRTATAGAPMPPVLVVVPLGWAALLALAVVVTPVAVAAVAIARRPDPAAELRAAEAT